jgi:hypothetical protein
VKRSGAISLRLVEVAGTRSKILMYRLWIHSMVSIDGRMFFQLLSASLVVVVEGTEVE